MYYTLFNLILISFCSSSGVLAWGTVTTIALILIIVKRLLRTGCKCTCERRRYRNPGDVEDPTTQPRTVPPAEHHSTSLETIAVHLHTPPSQATTPETSSLAYSRYHRESTTGAIFIRIWYFGGHSTFSSTTHKFPCRWSCIIQHQIKDQGQKKVVIKI